MPTILTAAALLAAACSGGEAIDVEKAWARTSPMVTSAGAVYMDLTSTDGDRLIGANVDPSVAATVELHETVMADMGDEAISDDSMSDDGMEDMGGAMTMQQVSSIDLAAGETVSLEPGGLHIMLLDLTEPLQSGETFDLTLQFETAGEMVVEIEVSDEAP